MDNYVWMRLGESMPVKVSTEGEEISRKMWQGYVQCGPPEEKPKKEGV